MEIIPSIDVRAGKVVRLHQGDYAKETVYADDPVAVARQFAATGATRIHIVDLDGAAAGKPVLLETLKRIIAGTGVPIQTGGGVRTLEAIANMLAIGIDRVVLGTVAVEQPALVQQAIAAHGAERVIVGLDARDGIVAVRGWKEQSSLKVDDLLVQMAGMGVRRFLYTDIARDGTLTSPNFEAYAAAVAIARPLGAHIIASGGVSALWHLPRLAEIGLEAAIIGRAIYTGDLPLADALKAVDAPKRGRP